MTLLIRMPQRLLEDDYSRRLATAPSTLPDILRVDEELNPGLEGSRPSLI